MENVKNTFQVTKNQIRSLFDSFKCLSDSYREKDSSLSDAEWLAEQYKAALPTLSDKEAEVLGNSTVNGVNRFNMTLKEAMTAAADGKNREQWFSEKMSHEIAEMDIVEAGDCVHVIDAALLTGNRQMAEGVPVQAEENAFSVAIPQMEETYSEGGAVSSQWNPFTIKETLSHIGQGAALMGLQTMNNTESLDFVADALENMGGSDEILRTLVESGDTQQLKTLLTAVLKIGVDKGVLPLIPKSASVDTIAGITSHGVEYISALAQFSSGKITMMQAMDHMGISGVSLLYNLCSAEGIRNISTALLSQIPVVGPILGNVVGGIISATIGKKYHEKMRATIQKVENTVRSAVNAAWNKIKTTGQKIKEKVKSFCNWLFA